MQAVVLLNEHAGGGFASGAQDTISTIHEALDAVSIEGDIRRVSGNRLREEAQSAIESGATLVVAAGGDGTVSAVAGALAGGEIPLGVIPLGTLNHFAKDMGIPTDLADAVDLLAQGHLTSVDVGRVNGRIFLNNSSLGAYASAVIDRDEQRSRLGRWKWSAMAIAMARVFRRYPLLAVRLQTDDESRVAKTPLVFVGNNQYQLDLFRVGQRCCLDRGELSLYVATAHTRWGMTKLAIRAALGRLRQSRDFEASCGSQVRIETFRKQVAVALDGEVELLRPPLEYSIWPGALRVVAPQQLDVEKAHRTTANTGAAAVQ